MSSVLPIRQPNRTLESEVEFVVPGAAALYTYEYAAGAGAPPDSATFVPRTVSLRDVRELAAPTLEAHGLAFLRSPTAVADLYDAAAVERDYFPECAALLRRALGAREVIVYDHNVRRGQALALKPDRYDQGRPVPHAHTDYSGRSALRRLREILGPAAADAERRRYVQVNLWRPIRGPVRDRPLALCDGASLGPGDLQSSELRYPDRTGELYYLAHGPSQRWIYASDMQPDEAWVFKNFDSRPPAGVIAVPHCAVADPRYAGARVGPRESIEVRAFALFDA
ncbi:MAG: methyltransferase [Proteobacteria bacterium]|nr:methyltransferase [Pseudomonadota bacterium]